MAIRKARKSAVGSKAKKAPAKMGRKKAAHSSLRGSSRVAAAPAKSARGTKAASGRKRSARSIVAAGRKTRTVASALKNLLSR